MPMHWRVLVQVLVDEPLALAAPRECLSLKDGDLNQLLVGQLPQPRLEGGHRCARRRGRRWGAWGSVRGAPRARRQFSLFLMGTTRSVARARAAATGAAVLAVLNVEELIVGAILRLHGATALRRAGCLSMGIAAAVRHLSARAARRLQRAWRRVFNFRRSVVQFVRYWEARSWPYPIGHYHNLLDCSHYDLSAEAPSSELLQRVETTLSTEEDESPDFGVWRDFMLSNHRPVEFEAAIQAARNDAEWWSKAAGSEQWESGLAYAVYFVLASAMDEKGSMCIGEMVDWDDSGLTMGHILPGVGDVVVDPQYYEKRGRPARNWPSEVDAAVARLWAQLGAGPGEDGFDFMHGYGAPEMLPGDQNLIRFPNSGYNDVHPISIDFVVKAARLLLTVGATRLRLCHEYVHTNGLLYSHLSGTASQLVEP